MKIPGDGNCLYNSVAHQLYKFPINANNLNYYSQLLRLLAANYIQDHLTNVLRENVLVTCHDLFGNEFDDETLILHYLENMRFNQLFWGGEEALSALSNIYRSRINIYLTTGEVTTINPEGSAEVQEINIFYHHNHYDSILTVKAARDSLPLLPHPTQYSDNSQFNPEEIEYSQRVTFEPISRIDLRSVTVATWNVNGGSSVSKREEINMILETQQVGILCLQEVRTTSRIIYSEKYKWFINAHNRKRSFRGTAILLSKDLYCYFRSFTSITENICVIRLAFGANEITHHQFSFTV